MNEAHDARRDKIIAIMNVGKHAECHASARYIDIKSWRKPIKMHPAGFSVWKYTLQPSNDDRARGLDTVCVILAI